MMDNKQDKDVKPFDVKKFLGIEIKEIPLKNGKTYRIQKGIFLGVVILLLGYAVIVMSMNNFDKTQHFYITCPATATPCMNSLYQSYPACEMVSQTSDFCNTELLPPQFEYGIKPPAVLQFFGIYTIILLLLAFTINHLIYNKGFLLKEVIGKEGVILEGDDDDDSRN